MPDANSEQGVQNVQEGTQNDQQSQGQTQVQTQGQITEPVTTTQGDTSFKAQGMDNQAANEGLPEEILSYAESLGITKEELDSFGSHEAAQKALDLIESKIVSIGRNELAQRQQQVLPQMQPQNIIPVQQPMAGVTPQNVQQDQGPLKFEPYKIEPKLLDKDTYDETLVGEIQRLNEHYSGLFNQIMQQMPQLENIKRIENSVNQYFQETEQQRIVKFQNEVDKTFESTIENNKELEPILGKGDLKSVSKNQSQLSNRTKVLEMMDILEVGYSKLGKEIPSFETLFNRALKLTFPDNFKSQVRKEIASSLQKTKKSMSLKPSNRDMPSNLTPEQRGIAFAENFIKERKGG